MKIASFFRPWRVNGPEMPPAYLQMTTFPADANLPEYFKMYENYIILRRPNNLYAYVKAGETVHACRATSLGGNIDVQCNTPSAGTLYVIERALGGWTAAQDGLAANLLPDPWLALYAPAGKHAYSFRYQPWDAPVGLGLSILGWIAAITGLIYSSKKDKSGV
jgi:hypothetical protein